MKETPGAGDFDFMGGNEAGSPSDKTQAANEAATAIEGSVIAEDMVETLKNTKVATGGNALDLLMQDDDEKEEKSAEIATGGSPEEPVKEVKEVKEKIKRAIVEKAPPNAKLTPAMIAEARTLAETIGVGLDIDAFMLKHNLAVFDTEQVLNAPLDENGWFK